MRRKLPKKKLFRIYRDKNETVYQNERGTRYIITNLRDYGWSAYPSDKTKTYYLYRGGTGVNRLVLVGTFKSKKNAVKWLSKTYRIVRPQIVKS